MTTDRDNLADRFLLGKLGEQETLKLEEDYFSNTKLFEEILAAENDLIDAYAMGKLSADDRSRFENRLLLNPHQRERVRFAKTLVKYASSHPLSTDDVILPAAKTSRLSAFTQLFSGKPLLSLSFSLAALLFFIGAIWLVFDKSEGVQNNEIAERQIPPPITNETANSSKNAETKPDAAPSPQKSVQAQTSLKPEKPQKKAPVIYSLILSPGLTRDGGANQTFTIPARTELVRMRLNFEQGGFSLYHATLETVEGRQVWSARLKAPKEAKSVEVSIPSKLLKKSDYILALKGITQEGVSERVEDYAFTISP